MIESTAQKMKYFERNSKYNFIDENNTFVGYDSEQDCCEKADWKMFDHIPEDVLECESLEKGDLPGYVFDVNFFQEGKSKQFEEFDCGGKAAIFRLTRPGHQDRYLCLYNHHNGYYGHGFEAKHDGMVIQSGVL